MGYFLCWVVGVGVGVGVGVDQIICEFEMIKTIIN